MAKELFDISDNRRTVKALKRGNNEAFEAVYHAYFGKLLTYSTTILQDKEAASEVVQDTYASLWMNRHKLDADKPLCSYLLRAVHNNSLKLLQLNANRRSREEKAAKELCTDDTTMPIPSTQMESLSLAIERLPEQSKKVLQMTYWEEKKHADVAQELSISRRTVETILYKVIKRLRGEMQKG